jgi:hypothetical protein
VGRDDNQYNIELSEGAASEWDKLTVNTRRSCEGRAARKWGVMTINTRGSSEEKISR